MLIRKKVSLNIILMFTLIMNGGLSPVYADDNGNEFIIVPLINADYGDGGRLIQHPKTIPIPCQDQTQQKGPRVIQVQQKRKLQQQGFDNPANKIDAENAPKGYRGKILDRGHDDNPYTVIDHYDFFLKLGVAAVFVIAPSVGVGVGGAVDGGRQYKSRRYVDGQENAHDIALNLKYLKRPKSTDDFEQWNDGDYLRYKNNLGLSLFTFAGAGYVGYAGVKGRIGGEWDVRIKKIDDLHIKVMLKNAVKLTGKLMAGIFPLLNSTAGKGFKHDNGISLIFDISNPEARDALDKFLDKNNSSIQKAQILAQNNEGVSIHGEMKENKNSTEFKYKLRFPFVASYEKSKRKLRSKRQTSAPQEGQRTTVHSTAIVKEKKTKSPKIRNKTRRKHAHYANTLVFKAAQGLQIQKTDENGIEIPGISNIAEYSYSFMDDTAKVKDARKALEKLKKETGLEDELEVWFPEEKELGYVGIEFKLAFAKGFMQQLKDHLTQDQDYLQHMGQSTIDEYFNGSQPKRICGSEPLSVSKLDRCMHSAQKDVSRKLRKLSNKIMELDFSSIDGIKSSDYMADLVHKISSHPLVMKTFLSLDIPEIKATFRVEGEKFLPYQSDLVEY